MTRDHRRYAPVPVLEKELLKEMSVGGFRFTEAWHRACSTIERHAHRRATITILINGSFEEAYPFHRDILCEAPAVHVRPPGEPHTDRLGTAGAHNLVLEIDDDRLESLHRHSALFDEIRHLESTGLLTIVRRLRRELLIDDEATPLSLEGLSMELLATASRQTSRSLGQPAPWLARIHDLLHDRFLEPRLSLDKLAQIAGVHPVHLARSFRSVYGASPGEYLRRLRVDWAAEELTCTSKTLSEIALAAGFADQSHFTRVFRSVYGMPPGAWRTIQTSS